MTSRWLQRAFRPIKARTPSAFWLPIRTIATAALTPIRFSYRSGHLRSSFRNMAVDRYGNPLPWYTYPAIDFLAARDFAVRRVLEFGAGQSTLWWAKRAHSVVSVEEDEAWFRKLKSVVPASVQLVHIPVDHSTRTIEPILRYLETQRGVFDVIVIDGHLRREIVKVAFSRLASDGALIVDNAEGYGIFEETKTRACHRIDFVGYTPGVILPHCTSIFFQDHCFLLSASVPITVNC